MPVVIGCPECSITGHADTFTQVFDERSRAIAELMDGRTAEMAREVEDRGRAVLGVLGTRISEVSALFDDRGSTVADLIDSRGRAAVVLRKVMAVPRACGGDSPPSTPTSTA